MSERNLRLLTADEKQRLYVLPEFTDTDREHYFTLQPDEQLFLNHLRNPNVKLHFCLQLAYFKCKWRLFTFSFDDVNDDVAYVCRQYLPKVNFRQLQLPARNTLRRNNQHILQLYHYRDDRQAASQLFQKKISLYLHQSTCPIGITQKFIQALRQANIIVPAYTTLQNWMQRALSAEEARIEKVTTRYLPKKVTASLVQLLTDENEFALQALKTDPKNFKYYQMQHHIKLFNEYYPLYEHIALIMPKLRLSSQAIGYYASLIDYYNRYELNEIKSSLTYLYLLCYVYLRIQKMADHIITAIGYLIERYQKQGKDYATKNIAENIMAVHKDLPKGGQLLRQYNDEALYNKPFANVASEAHLILPKDQLETVCNFLERKNFDRQALYWEYYEAKQKMITLNLRPLFKAITFNFGPGQQPLKKSLEFLSTLFAENKSLTKVKQDSIPKAFIPRHLKSVLIDDQNTINIARYEFCVYLCLYHQLEKGTIYCQDSTQYRSFDYDTRDIINWDDPKTRANIIRQLDVDELSLPADAFLQRHADTINAQYDRVNQRIRNKENTHVKVKETDTGIQWRSPYKRQKPAFNNPFYDQIQHTPIMQVVECVDGLTGCLDALTALKEYRSKRPLNKGVATACILGNALGHGAHGMSKISNFSYKVLYRTEKSRIRVDTLRDCNDIVINHYLQLPIVKRYNVADALLWANADGQKYKTIRDTFQARHSSKYFTQGTGVVAYSSIMNSIAVATKMIGPNEHESHHLVELMQLNRSDAKIDCVATDTEGANQANFALLKLVGINFTPCYRTLVNKFKSAVCFKPLSHYESDDFIIKPAMKAKVGLIKQEWHNIQPIFASILLGEVDASTIVRKLSSGKFKSKTKEALWAYNQILLTEYLLNYVDDVDLQGYVRLALNRGEAYHQLRRKISHALAGQMRGRNDTEVAIWNECGRLIANMIIFYNAYILSALLEQKEREGDGEAVELLCRISPIACQHLNLGGLFEFNAEENPIDIEAMIQQFAEILQDTLKVRPN